MFRRGIAKSALKALAVIAQVRASTDFYLAGGTAAALQIGHRLSIDLDFFSAREFESQDLSMTLERGGVKLSDIKLAHGTLHCNIEQTRVSFFHYPYRMLAKPKVFEDIELASLLDIALMKITAIASRGSKKDFIDLYFILKELGLQRLLEEFGNKFPIEKLDPYHYLKSLIYFEDAERDPMPKMLVACRWEKVKAELEKHVAKLQI